MSEAPGYRRFFADLKRREVFRVAAVYGAAAFVAIQAADVIFPRVPLPESTASLVVWLAILGFPLAVALAWVYERTPDGLHRTDPAAAMELEAIAAMNLALGDTESPMRRLERAFELGDASLLVIGVSPVYDPLRTDPRMIRLTRELGVPNGYDPAEDHSDEERL